MALSWNEIKTRAISFINDWEDGDCEEEAVLDALAQPPYASLADLYDPNTMPATLVMANQALDKAVDFCY